MPVSQVAGGLAFRAQTATSVIVAPVTLILGSACAVPALTTVP